MRGSAGKGAAPALLACALLGASACGKQSPQAIAGVQGRMEFARGQDLWTAPFPSDDLREAGALVPASFPNPGSVDLIARTLALLRRDADGFGLTSGAFLPFTGAVAAARLPSVAESSGADAKAFLLSIDADAADALQRHPVRAAFAADGGPFGSPYLLSLVPVQGLPLEPRHAYAAVVRRSLQADGGAPLGVSLALARLLAGERPAGLGAGAFALYQRALAAVQKAGVPLDDLAALAAFTTGDPAAPLTRVRDDGLQRAPPLPASLALREVHDAYCVFGGIAKMPDWQAGTPPFTDSGGGWTFDAAGAPVFQRFEDANFFVTVPRAPMPAAGWPAVLYVRAGGAGEKPFVDRGPSPAQGQPDLAGQGPAMHFAEVGWAAVEVDGPVGGLRNTTHGDEQFLVFNFLNPEALRDNVRQSAVELSLVSRVLGQLSVEASACPGTSAGPQTLDPAHLAIWGHSTGATIAPLAAAIEPLLGAAILSGAGGSYLENVLWKKEPIEVRPLAEALLGYTALHRSLDASDPVLSLIQWAAEPADPQIYARAVIRAPAAGAPHRHVLMFQGVVDHYILPPLVQSLALPLGADQGGPALDGAVAEYAPFDPLQQALLLSGRGRIALPAQGNLSLSGAPVTAVVVQHPEDGIEDGHEVVFQTEAPKHQYRCFLRSWAVGVPRVPADGAARDPCE